MENLVEKTKQFLENEARSCSMEFGCVTPIYVYRMWGGINENDCVSFSQMTSQQSTDARQIYSSRSGSRELREGKGYIIQEIENGLKELKSR